MGSTILSIVAEFARELHEKESEVRYRSFTPTSIPYRVEQLNEVQAVICDIYGTLVNYWCDDFADAEKKDHYLLRAFKKTADYFHFTPYFLKINPQEPPEKTLKDFYHGLIALNHEKNLKKGISFPEILIENIWETIIMMLERHGYQPPKPNLGERRDQAKCAAFYYHFYSLPRGLYDGIYATLTHLSSNNILLGIVSNAQFYTPIDLTLFFRDQSNRQIDDYTELFHPDLLFYSYEQGVAKPNSSLFRKLYDSLYELQILPSQTVFIGNDLSQDIKPAQEAGMLTALFTGDDKSTYQHDNNEEIIPDIIFDSWPDLTQKISFHKGKLQP